MKLPLFLTPKLKYPVGFLMFGLAFVMYHVSGHYPFTEPRLLPMTAIDQAIPFIPWSVLIYVSEYFFFTAVYVICKDMENLNKYLYSFFATQLFSCIIFYFWPIAFPRELFPVPADTHPFLQTVWTWLRSTDTASNCFPSLHVSTVYLSVYIFLDEQRKKLPFFLIWGTLIALSTLPTKQHYIVDLFAGWILSVFAYYFFHRFAAYKRVDLAEWWSARSSSARVRD